MAAGVCMFEFQTPDEKSAFVQQEGSLFQNYSQYQNCLYTLRQYTDFETPYRAKIAGPAQRLVVSGFFSGRPRSGAC